MPKVQLAHRPPVYVLGQVVPSAIGVYIVIIVIFGMQIDYKTKLYNTSDDPELSCSLWLVVMVVFLTFSALIYRFLHVVLATIIVSISGR